MWRIRTRDGSELRGGLVRCAFGLMSTMIAAS
jgi:hypothetical protein